jgi:AcrR family transcriptional regulator
MLSKRDIKRLESQKKIIEAAVRLFSKHSFTSISMRDIAKEANISAALIYKYFDDQQHLYFEAMKAEGKKLISEMEQQESLGNLVYCYIQYMFTQEVLYQMMAYYMLEVNRPQALLPIIPDISRLMDLFEQGLKAKYKAEARQEAQLLFSTLNGLLITYKNLPVFSQDQALKHVHTLAGRYLSHITKDC